MTAEATPMHRWVFPVPVPPMKIAVPRNRAGSFEPQLIPKGQTRFEGFDDKISSLHARGMTVREIQGHLIEIHGIDVSPDLISRVTDSVLDEVHEWQGRPLDPVHPIVFFDASRVKIRAEGSSRTRRFMSRLLTALAYNANGEKEVLGLWIEQTEGAKFRPRVKPGGQGPRRQRIFRSPPSMA
jgi:putative transposase